MRGDVATIYLITNMTNGKLYVGITQYPVMDRWCRHRGAARRGVKTAIASAIRKYGRSAFSIIPIDTCRTIEEAKGREKYWISQYRSNVKTFGYNLTEGGEHCTLSDEAKQRISQKNKGRKPSPAAIEAVRARCLTGEPRRYKWLSTEEIVARYEQGSSTPEIAKMFGVNKTTIQRRLYRAGVCLSRKS